MIKNLLLILIIITSSFLFAQPGLKWVNSHGSLQQDEGTSIITDKQGNMYVAGYYMGNVDFDPGTGNFFLFSNGAEDIFIQKLDPLGNLIWAKSIGGNGSEWVESIALDSLDNLYIIGTFEGTCDFDPSSSNTYNLTSSGMLDIFVEKLDMNGNFVWAKAFYGDTLYDDYGGDICVGTDGYIYLIGTFRNTVDFDLEAGTYNMTAAAQDIFVEKINPDGKLQWVFQIGNSGTDVAMGICSDGDGNVLISGYFENTVDFNPGPTFFPMNGVGGDAFVLKVDTGTNFIWAKKLGGLDDQYGVDLKTDLSNNILVTGYMWGTMDLDPGTGNYSVTSNGSYDVFTVKLDSAGNFLWGNSTGGSNNDRGISISPDGLNTIVSGFFRETVDFDPGAGIINITSMGFEDIFIQKLDSNGGLDWVLTFGGNVIDKIHSIAVNDSGEIFGTGSFMTTVDFDPSASTSIYTSNGSNDIYVIKLSDNGGVGIDELANKYNFSIYPNPTIDYIYINGNKESIKSIQIYNIHGQLQQIHNDIYAPINLSELSNGIYFITIRGENFNYSKRIIKI